MITDYAKTKWAAVNRICRRYEGYKAPYTIHSHLGKWTGNEAEPHVVINAHLKTPEDITKLISMLSEITGAWPKEKAEDGTEH